MSKTSDISASLRVVTQAPLDSKLIFNTLNELTDLGDQNNLAFTYYEGMNVYCIETKTFYSWREINYGENGIIPGAFSYPPKSESNGIDYSGRVFNFVISSKQDDLLNLFYLEPSVNIEIRNDITNIEQAFHFGNFDIGFGNQDYALVKKTFVPQSGYNLFSQKNRGDEIKIYNATNKKYLGHFKVTTSEYNQEYVLLDIIEKGDWTPEGTMFPTQKIVINILKETNYSIELMGSLLTIYRGSAAVGNVDFQGLFAGGGGGAPTSAVLNPETGIVTFTFSNNTSFDTDFSALLNADDHVKRSGNIASKGKDIYENLFVLKSGSGSYGKGYYAADLTTNYTSTSIQGFPYPSARDYVVFLYLGVKYLMVKKNIYGLRRLFLNPNSVLGFTFYKYKSNTEKSMKFLAYFKILSRKANIVNLNTNYYAFPIHGSLNTTLPFPISTPPFDEKAIKQGLNEAQAYCLVSQITEEKLPLKKRVTAPYTIKEEDNGRVLHINGSGSVTVPKLNYGFECGLIQASSDSNSISIAPGSGVQILKPSSKTRVLRGQYHTAYIMANEEYNDSTTIPLKTSAFLLLGDLKDS